MFEMEFGTMRNEQKLAKWLETVRGMTVEAAEIVWGAVAGEAGWRQ